MRLLVITFSFALGLAVLGASSAAQAENPDDLLIIAHKSVTESSLSLDEVRLIFLKKKRVWTSGQDIVVLHDFSTTGLRHRFDKEVLGLKVSDEQRYWREEAVRRSLTPPKEIETRNHARLKKVFGIKGAISYVLRRDFLPDVAKVLAVVPVTAP